jgi:hypothetical protein
MVTFAVDPALLAPLVPVGTELDQHEGQIYLSVVAFQFLDTRLLGVRVPLHHQFEELNLRFYVRREVAGELRRAVVFVREVVPRWAIAFIARAFYNEPYVALPMGHAVSGSPPHVEYRWHVDGSWHKLAAQGEGPGVIPPPDGHAAFITEHYWGYTRQRDGRTLEYRVDHSRWKVWPAHLAELPRLEPLYGANWASALTQPSSVLIADGSAVTVFRGVHLAERVAVT